MCPSVGMGTSVRMIQFGDQQIREDEFQEFMREREIRLMAEYVERVKIMNKDGPGLDYDLDELIDRDYFDNLDPIPDHLVGFEPAPGLATLPQSCNDEFDVLAQGGLDWLRDNNKPGSGCEFSRVVQANWFDLSGLYYYVTFEATDASGVVKTFQVKGSQAPSLEEEENNNLPFIKVDMCRLKEPISCKRKSIEETSDIMVEAGEAKRKNLEEFSGRETSSSDGQGGGSDGSRIPAY